MFYYRTERGPAASFLPDLPLESAPPGAPALFLTRRDPDGGPAVLRASDPRQLAAGETDVSYLDPSRLPPLPEPVPEPILTALKQGLPCANLGHPRWREALAFHAPRPGKKRVHLLAVGDVGGTLLIALKLLGGDAVSSVGICDLNQSAVDRSTAELGQIAWPGD